MAKDPMTLALAIAWLGLMALGRPQRWALGVVGLAGLMVLASWWVPVLDLPWVPELGLRMSLGAGGAGSALALLILAATGLAIAREPSEAPRELLQAAITLLALSAGDLILLTISMVLLAGMTGPTGRRARLGASAWLVLGALGLAYLGGTQGDLATLLAAHPAAVAPLVAQRWAFAGLALACAPWLGVWPFPHLELKTPENSLGQAAGAVLGVRMLMLLSATMPGPARDLAPAMGALAIFGIVRAGWGLLSQRSLGARSGLAAWGLSSVWLGAIATFSGLGWGVAAVLQGAVVAWAVPRAEFRPTTWAWGLWLAWLLLLGVPGNPVIAEISRLMPLLGS